MINDYNAGYMGILPPAGMDDGGDNFFPPPSPQPVYGNQGARRARPQDDDGDGGAEAEAEEAEPPEYYPVGCADMEEMLRDLGPPAPMHKCWGCRYVGQYKAAKIPDVKLRMVFQTMAEGIGVSWPSALAVEVSILHEKWRTEVNKTRGEDDKIPKWSPATILQHWELHTCDPEIRQWLDLCRLQKEMYDIKCHSMEQRSRITGKRRKDKEQSALFHQHMRAWYFVSAKDPRKLSYFNEGAMLDRGSVTNPAGISMKDRPVYNWFGKAGGGGGAATGKGRKRRVANSSTQ
jgi:hypothetical protein